MTMSYRIGWRADGEQYIECLRCERKSFNKNDIEHKYCGKCGQHPLPAPNNTEIGNDAE